MKSANGAAFNLSQDKDQIIRNQMYSKSIPHSHYSQGKERQFWRAFVQSWVILIMIPNKPFNKSQSQKNLIKVRLECATLSISAHFAESQYKIKFMLLMSSQSKHSPEFSFSSRSQYWWFCSWYWFQKLPILILIYTDALRLPA